LGEGSRGPPRGRVRVGLVGVTKIEWTALGALGEGSRGPPRGRVCGDLLA
jgi:hypothetical protein